MRSFLFIMLAGYAVKCNDASYYVIEMLEEVQRDYAKPFRVYWNVPTMQCTSKKIPFTGLFDKFGIIQNDGDSFRGEKVSILYDPGLFPALLKNETSGKFKFRNGGVPQEGDLEKHLIAFRNTLEQSVPDENFSGIGIIDFESWRPVFRQNFGVLIPYKDISYQIERKLHWFWTERAIQARARQRFEESGRAFMQTTLSVAKQLRPRGLWGYYGFPYCFNMASNNMVESCSDKVKQENDKTYWLWSESTALYPSVYSSNTLTGAQLAALVRGRMAEAARVARGSPVLPYFWFRYREGGFLTQTDLDTVLETLYKSNASGFIIWGSSNDVNTVEKCNSLLQYTEEVLGPAIAKYTKAYLRNTTESPSNSVSNIGLTTWRPILRDHIQNSTISKPILDPEYHWVPPENYTQDIVHYVDQELKKKPGYNTTDRNGNDTLNLNNNRNLLIEIILNIFKSDKKGSDENNDVKKVINDISYENRSPNENSTNIIDFSILTSTEYSIEHNTMNVPNIVTRNPMLSLLKNKKKGTIDIKYTDTDSNEQKTSNNNTTSTSYTTTGFDSFTEKYNVSTEYIVTNDSQENMTTTTELHQVTENENEILYDRTEKDANVANDSQKNLPTTSELNLEMANADESTSFAEGTNISTETTRLSTFDSTYNTTESNPNLNYYTITSPNRDFTNVPTNLGTDTLIEEVLNHTTSHNFTEILLADKLDSIEDRFNKDELSNSHDKGHVSVTAIENSFFSFTDLETTTEEFSKATESLTNDYRDNIYDDAEGFNTEVIKNEDFIPVNIIETFSSINTTISKDNKKGEPLVKHNESTNTESILRIGVKALSTTENTELTKTEVPDVEKEGFRIDGITEDGETTTNAREVAGTSYGAVVKSNYILTILSFLCLTTRKIS